MSWLQHCMQPSQSTNVSLSVAWFWRNRCLKMETNHLISSLVWHGRSSVQFKRSKSEGKWDDVYCKTRKLLQTDATLHPPNPNKVLWGRGQSVTNLRKWAVGALCDITKGFSSSATCFSEGVVKSKKSAFSHWQGQRHILVGKHCRTAMCHLSWGLLFTFPCQTVGVAGASDCSRTWTRSEKKSSRPALSSAQCRRWQACQSRSQSYWTAAKEAAPLSVWPALSLTAVTGAAERLRHPSGLPPSQPACCGRRWRRYFSDRMIISTDSHFLVLSVFLAKTLKERLSALAMKTKGPIVH